MTPGALRPAVVWATALLMTGAVISGCGADEEGRERRADERAEQARVHVDDLVKQLGGTAVEVVSDDIGECLPPASGLEPNYAVRFTVGADAADRLQGEIAEDLEADGWTVRRDGYSDGETGMRFWRTPYAISSRISDTGQATAVGSSGCVE